MIHLAVRASYCNASPKPEFSLFSLFIFSFIYSANYESVWVEIWSQMILHTETSITDVQLILSLWSICTMPTLLPSTFKNFEIGVYHFCMQTLHLEVIVGAGMDFTLPGHYRKQVAYNKQATRGPTALSPFWGTRQWGIKCLAQGHYCRCQSDSIRGLIIENLWYYPLSHYSSCNTSMLHIQIEVHMTIYIEDEQENVLCTWGLGFNIFSFLVLPSIFRDLPYSDNPWKNPVTIFRFVDWLSSIMI